MTETAPIPQHPHLRRVGDATQLFVHGQPRLLLAGELENSTASGRHYRAPVWPRLAAAHVDTVLAVVPWDLVEPEEGRFDFGLVDELVQEARAHRLSLVLLWFGCWKNALSHYAPLWVKRDTDRFPRCRIAEGNTEALTPVAVPARQAEARAFARFMKHLREIDGDTRTVLMVQVDNEVGLFGARRDHSALGDAAFLDVVPQALVNHLVSHHDALLPETRAMWQLSGERRGGTWSEVFPGPGHAEEVFMAWHFAAHVGFVAAAGKAEYDIPLFANAALDSPVPAVTEYFQGGPVAQMADIWRAAAPAIDMLCPDIYQRDFNGIVSRYQRGGNPLFVPESFGEGQGPANAFFTIGRGGMGYAPFAVEQLADLMDGPLAASYAMLRDLAPDILAGQAAGTIAGARVSPYQPEDALTLGRFTFQIRRLTDWRAPATPIVDYGGCLILRDTAVDTYLIAGIGVQIQCSVADPGRVVGLGSVDELVRIDARWQRDRRLCGDEIMDSYAISDTLRAGQTGTSIKTGTAPKVLRVTLYDYER